MIRVEVPRAFKPLLRPARYKGAYGGRGGAKSHFFAEQLILRCYAQPTRAVGIREIQLSIRDSVRQLLIDKIQKLGLGSFFEITDAEIRGRNGSNIVFRGMQNYNAETIKSLEGYDLAWVEEAQTLSQHSLDLLRPTIRKPGSELWFSWNPRHRTDPVDAYFRKSPLPADQMISVCVNWRDNPWFPEVLRKDMEHDRATDAELADHIWDGGYAIGHGMILARHIERAERDGRITDSLEYDPGGAGIEISSDIGLYDTSTWWFWQRRVGGAAILDYDRDSGLFADEWCKRLDSRLKERGWKLGRIWLPHDARNKTFAAKHSAIEQFVVAFGGSKVAIVPRSDKEDRINAARTFVQKTAFHKTRCEDGINGLRAWEYEYNPETQVFSKMPKHNWASHDGDGFSYGCQVMQGMPAPAEEKTPEPMRGVENIKVGELWRMAKKAKRDRY